MPDIHNATAPHLGLIERWFDLEFDEHACYRQVRRFPTAKTLGDYD